MKKILITGSDGFIAKNLKTRLLSSGNYEVFEFNRQSTKEQLEEYLLSADVQHFVSTYPEIKNYK